MNMNNPLQEFFQAIQVIYTKDQALQQERLRRGESYNLLSILGLFKYELKHSAILANLLDPHGSHGCGSAFLRAFFDVLSIPYPFEDDKQVTSRTEVYAGKVTESTGGRIDILVSCKGYGLIIENKIYAEDQNSQLVRYDTYGKEQFARYDLLYLTLSGSEASEQSVTTKAGLKVDYRPISYADKGLVWLTQCARLAYDKPLVRESINQYIQIIKQLTYQDMNQENINEIVKLGVDNPEAVAILSSMRNDIARGIREKYIFLQLKAYAESKNWEMSVEENCDEPHIRFKRDGWDGSIIVSSECGKSKANKGWWMGLWIGVDWLKEGTKKLQCLKTSTARYPYGYEYLKVPNWYSEQNFPEMKSNVAIEIIEKIKQIEEELDLC